MIQILKQIAQEKKLFKVSFYVISLYVKIFIGNIGDTTPLLNHHY